MRAACAGSTLDVLRCCDRCGCLAGLQEAIILTLQHKAAAQPATTGAAAQQLQLLEVGQGTRDLAQAISINGELNGSAQGEGSPDEDQGVTGCVIVYLFPQLENRRLTELVTLLQRRLAAAVEGGGD